MIESILNLQLNIVIESKPVKQVIKCKILWVIVDQQHLWWKCNTENIICKKITVGIFALRRLKEFVDRQTFKMLLFAHTLITDVKYGMCSVKHSQNDSKILRLES